MTIHRSRPLAGPCSWALVVCWAVTSTGCSEGSGDGPATAGGDWSSTYQDGAPRIAKVYDRSVHPGDRLSLPCQVIIGRAPIRWSLDRGAIERGLEIDERGVISWDVPSGASTPTETLEVAVSAANDLGTSQTTFRVTIHTGPNSPPGLDEVSAIGRLRAGEEGLLVVSCTVRDAEGGPLEAVVDLAPFGGDWQPLELVHESAETRELQWIGEVRSETPDTYRLAIRATDSSGAEATREATIEVGEATAEPALPVEVLSAAELGGPDAVLVYRGLATRGEVPVPLDHLVGVVRGDEWYLYHPAQGDIELTGESTREALGLFIEGLSRSDAFARVAAKVRGREKASAAPDSESCQRLPLGQETRLGTGILAQRTAPRRCRFRNSTKRWMAVAPHPDGRTSYLFPNSDLGAVTGWSRFDGFLDALDTVLSGNGILDDASADVEAERADVVGSVTLALGPMLFLGGNPISDLGPLAGNLDFAEGDKLVFGGGALLTLECQDGVDTAACRDMKTMVARGVDIPGWSGEQCCPD